MFLFIPLAYISMKSRDVRRRTVLKIAAGIGGVLSLGSTSAGAQSNEIEIEDWNDLDAIRENLNGDYVLVNDLDEATAGYDEHVVNPPAGFDPIGNEENPFTGTFDGNRREISGLQIDVPSDDQVGLFAHIRRGAVTDVTLSEVDVTGGSSVGGLVGFNTAPGTEEGPHGITNVDVSGSVSGTNRVGGIVGLSRTSAEITDSTAACEVIADGNSVGGLIGAHNGDIISESAATGSVDGEFNTGGFVGVNFDNINNCHATGDVEGETTGGFAGGNDSGAEITRSYATGDVTSNGRAGGFAGGNAGGTITESFAAGSVSGGENTGGFVSRNGNEFAEEDGFRAEITDCYAVGEVTGDERVGGFVGHNFFGDVEQSYAAGNVSGNESVGGFAGVNRDGSTANNVFWDATTAESSDGGIALSTAEMQGASATEEMGGFAFGNTWQTVVEDESINGATSDADGYPILSRLASEPQLNAQGISNEGPPAPGDGGQAPVALSLEAPGTVQPGGTVTVTAELTNRDVPEPSSGSIELTPVPEPLSLSSDSENPVFLGFAGNALPARGESVTQQFEINVPEEAAVEQELTLEAVAVVQNDTDEFNTTTTQTVTITDQQAPVERFDTNGEPGIQGDEVLDAISEFNEGGDVEATDVLDVISAFNENSG